MNSKYYQCPCASLNLKTEVSELRSPYYISICFQQFDNDLVNGKNVKKYQ